MLSRLFIHRQPDQARYENDGILRAEHIFLHPRSEEEYRVIVLDADDTLDVIIHYPNNDRECVWSILKDETPRLHADIEQMLDDEPGDELEDH